MPRVNPDQFDPNPAQRFFEWDGADGLVCYYNKEKKENVVINLPFKFVLLNRVCSIRGWHEPSKSGIISNEIKDTREQILTVRAFKGGTIATGLYRDIKDKVVVAGGHYTANLYVAVRLDPKAKEMAVAQLQLKGAGLNAWVEFERQHRDGLYTKGIAITGKVEGKNGKIVFQSPVFEFIEISKETDDEAAKLQQQVADYLTRYFAKSSTAKVDSAAEAPQPDAPEGADPGPAAPAAPTSPTKPQPAEPEEDDIPF